MLSAISGTPASGASAAPQYSYSDCRTVDVQAECQRRAAAEPFLGEGTEAWERWHSELDVLDGLIGGKGKYARLDIIHDVLRKWSDAGPCEDARTAYDAWRTRNSYLGFLDALAAEFQENGTYMRLVEQRIEQSKRSGLWERDIRRDLKLYRDKDRAAIEQSKRDFLEDWHKHRGSGEELAAKKLILSKLLDGELQATPPASPLV
ncbi:hypothetical protein [Bordetella genomosp. 9]|uniref:Uncharacterized protein n=1 Tax=Bordetella genomosp. 9 TaxID=1416803 RepID=A0A1W6Z232_9BORD|nr:hypothetical protein [Bordetella genomosp. 9]ARP86873.1 hypothetical protein CAL13_12145 [Bordetella genomosp. 9]